MMKSVHIISFLSLLIPGLTNASEDTHNTIIQLINSNELSAYWHIDSFPDRVPLSIALSNNVDAKTLHLSKFGEPVVFLTEALNNEDAFIVQNMALNKKELIIDYSYSPEGIHGAAHFQKEGAVWRLIVVTINEN